MKNLLILERSDSNATFQKTASGDYILEGIFSEIGKKNKNNRVYDEAEFIPHVNELAKKVKERKVLGELDHPKNFEVSLKNVSHVIEEISYDKSTRQVRGKIKLLDTDAGKQAKALVDAGVPIHISSRAAGVVESGGHVKVKRLFTYDLVHEPGFENAQLNRVNESFGFDLDDTLGIFEMDESIPGFELLNSETKNTPEKMNETKDESFVSMQSFEQYSNYIKDTFTTINEKLANLPTTESLTEGADNTELTKYVESIAKELNALSEKFNSLDENVDNLMAHNDYIIEGLEQVKDYAELVALKSDQGIEYSKKLAESHDSSVEYQKKIVSEVNERFQYQTKINESVDGLISHNDYIIENMEGIANFSEYLKENVQELGNYTERIVEGINENFNLVEGKSISTDNKTTNINESVTPANKSEIILEKSNENWLKDKSDVIHNLIESAKTQKAVEDDKDLHFLHFVTESKRNEFESLNEADQGTLVRAFADNKYFGTRDVQQIWENAIQPIAPTMNWLDNMPNKYKESYESLDENQQETIKLQASVLSLDSQYKVDHFWSTRDLRSKKVENVNESTNTVIDETKKPVEGENVYMNSVMEGLQKRFKTNDYLNS